MKRYLKILYYNSKAMFLTTLEYRVAYFFRIFRIFLDIGLTLLTLNILFLRTKTFGDWTKPEVFLVFSVYQFVSSFVYFFCGDSLVEVPSLVKDGELDLILLKPVDSQFLVSFKDAHPGNLYRILLSVAIFYFALSQIEERVVFINLFFGLLTIIVAIIIFYSLLLLIASASFYILDESLGEIFENFLSISRYPTDIFPKGVKILLTVIPVIFLVTIPSRIILGKFLPIYVLAFPIAYFFLILSRRCFMGALRSYTSAGG